MKNKVKILPQEFKIEAWFEIVMVADGAIEYKSKKPGFLAKNFGKCVQCICKELICEVA